MNPQEASLEWVLRTIETEMPAEQNPAQFADGLISIAEDGDVPIEALISWLHFRRPGKSFSLHSWRNWCDRYNATRAALSLIPGPGDPVKMCSNCGMPFQTIGEIKLCSCPQPST